MTIDDVVGAILRVVPGITSDLDELRTTWEEPPPITLVMSTLGYAYVREAAQLDDTVKWAFFRVVEDAFDDPEDSVRDAVATGLLEAIVSGAERRGVPPWSVVDPYAGARTRDYLRAWDDFTMQ